MILFLFLIISFLFFGGLEFNFLNFYFRLNSLISISFIRGLPWIYIGSIYNYNKKLKNILDKYKD